mmetsp:Transcript_9857/g.30079  ORF Transcript_9857/g.30079 Transcript_9857/m.30079 type:complete len:208 (-) Transcript_9857:1368-1991(-)
MVRNCCREVEELLFRSNVKRRAQYNATTFMTQVKLQPADVEVARSMISSYMTLFKQLTMDVNSVDLDVQETRLVASILVGRILASGISAGSQTCRLNTHPDAGVNRAFPFADAAADQLYDTSQFEVLFRVAHAQSFRSSTQALSLLQQVSEARESMADRFYRTLYSKLLVSEVRNSKNPSAFLNIVYRAMKNDTKVCRPEKVNVAAR